MTPRTWPALSGPAPRWRAATSATSFRAGSHSYPAICSPRTQDPHNYVAPAAGDGALRRHCRSAVHSTQEGPTDGSICIRLTGGSDGAAPRTRPGVARGRRVRARRRARAAALCPGAARRPGTPGRRGLSRPLPEGVRSARRGGRLRGILRPLQDPDLVPERVPDAAVDPVEVLHGLLRVLDPSLAQRLEDLAAVIGPERDAEAEGPPGQQVPHLGRGRLVGCGRARPLEVDVVVRVV